VCEQYHTLVGCGVAVAALLLIFLLCCEMFFLLRFFFSKIKSTRTPLFVYNSFNDPWQLLNILGLPCSPPLCARPELDAFHEFGSDFLASFVPFTNNTDTHGQYCTHEHTHSCPFFWRWPNFFLILWTTFHFFWTTPTIARANKVLQYLLIATCAFLSVRKICYYLMSKHFWILPLNRGKNKSRCWYFFSLINLPSPIVYTRSR